MTIAISLKVNDGLVLAADSASTLVGRAEASQTGVINVYNNANKVFNLYKGSPIGAITWGSGAIGAASISTLMKDFRLRLTRRGPGSQEWQIDPTRYVVEDIAVKLRRYMFEELYLPAFESWKDKPTLGFVVAGYSSGATMADEYQILIQGGACPPPALLRPHEVSGLTWNGEPEAITRLVLGFGTGLPAVLQNNLGVPADQVGPALEVLRQALTAPLVMPAMPIQDAIDLAEFLVDLTIKFSRFTPGAPSVGGPIEIAAITKHESFRWVKRKHYFTRELNPEE